jgi:hypothetical protein
MPRPKALKDLPLIPDITIRPEAFDKGFTGKVDSQGRIPAVGEEYAGREVYIFIKNGEVENK